MSTDVSSSSKNPIVIDTHSRIAAEAKLLKLHLQLLLEMRSARPHSVQIELLPNEISFRLLAEGADAAATPLKSYTAAGELSNAFLAFLLDRVAFWPDLGDDNFATNSQRVKRLLLAPASEHRMLADFNAQKKLGNAGTLITLTNIRFDEIRNPLEFAGLEGAGKTALENALKNKTGLILASSSSKPHQIDAVSLVLAARPEASFVKFCNSEKSAGEVLQLADSHLVVVGITDDDPVQAALNFLGRVSAHPTLVEQFDNKFLLSFLYTHVRRVCTSCSRSTPVDPRTLDRLPMLLRSRTKNTYMFGRGCNLCGHSAYRGTVALCSMFAADEKVRELLRQSASAGELTKYAYAQGTRTLLEDGLVKIFAGLTSFEEVFGITNNISPAFSGAIASSETNDAEDGEIEALDAKMFITNDPQPIAAPEKSRVMIVEDDNDQRVVLEGVFRTAGYEVVGAENGQVAIQSLKKQPVDLVICDVMMPVMNGAQFIKALRASAAMKQIPVLMLTAVSSPDAECAFLDHGADDYCEKNVQRKVLLKRVEKLLKRKVGAKNPLEHMLKD